MEEMLLSEPALLVLAQLQAMSFIIREIEMTSELILQRNNPQEGTSHSLRAALVNERKNPMSQRTRTDPFLWLVE
jgi:hypothetical protein